MAAAEEERKHSHPPYPEMILAAIAELGEKEGSNKSSISKIIESTYGDRLPEDHSAALSEALTNMKDNGELLLIKNNYSKPDADAPPRRGRGRPPKPKTSLSPEVDQPSPKQRGRPRKARGPLSVSGGKKRGRPPKKQVGAGGDAASSPDAAGGGSTPASAGVKRGRGRPPKVRTPVADVAVE